MTKDAKYFTTTKRGEISELKEELDSPKEEKKREAVKKVIAAMTVGKDVSLLFTDVVKCITTPNLELKKLVYLYLMNYAKTQPDLAILAVNSFVKDAQNTNPLIRALAVRTMGCIRVDKITEYLCNPLRATLQDPDPYVRKTAAVCVAKLYDIVPELVTEAGFLEILQNLLSDSNPMVVANAVAALSEIEETSKSGFFKITPAILQKLLPALNECTEWGQIFILNAISTYTPKDSREGENICERITPRLAHANSAVVLGAVKVLMKYMNHIQSQDTIRTLYKKMAPPLVTLLSKEPEIQYVALRNINLIAQKRPNILQFEIKVFFCKYNDPIYVKMEKLEIMLMLASERNIDQVLLEFKEYATEVDVEFVRKSVRAIGRCAIKIEKAAERCIHVLLELIQTKVNYVVQEAIVVIKDIFRKYPNQYESIIATLCENLNTLDEPEAKAAMIWIIGEYAERIDNADELLESFLESFLDESSQVQLQLLTATVKLFLKRPKDTQTMVKNVLNMATQESDNPDLRDRGFIYWRLLSTDPEAAKAVVLAEKPLIKDDSSLLETSLLDELVGYISTLSSVYHKPPETFVSKLRRQKVRAFKPQKVQAIAEEQQEAVKAGDNKSINTDLLDLVGLSASLPTPSPIPTPVQAPASPVVPSARSNINPSPPTSGGVDLNDLLGLAQLPQPSLPPTGVSKKLVLPADKGKGMQISAAFVRQNGGISYEMTIQNSGSTPLTQFAMQFNKNTFCLAPASSMLSVPAPVVPGSSVNISVPMSTNGPSNPAPPTTVIQIAVKNNVDIFYFTDQISLHVLFAEDGQLAKQQFLQLWMSIPDNEERFKDIVPIKYSTADEVMNKLKQHNVFFLSKKHIDGKEIMYASLKLVNGAVFLAELTIQARNSLKCCTRTKHLDLVPLFEQALQQLLQ